MLAEPKQVKMLRAPTYVDPAHRAKNDARRSMEKRGEREQSQSQRRAVSDEL